MSSAQVRTLPNFLPYFRLWWPVKVKVLVCGSMRERVNVDLTVNKIDGRFNWLFGSRSTNIICWKEPNSIHDECMGEVTIWPRQSGRPELLIHSEDSLFNDAIIRARGTPAPSMSFQSLDNKGGLDGWTYRIRRAKTIVRKALGAAIGGSIPYLLFWLTFGCFYPHTRPSTGATVVTPTPPVPRSELPVLPPTLATPPRSDCIFLDPDRAQDADGKVRVKCGGELYQATATYMGEGRFDFTDLTSSTP